MRRIIWILLPCFMVACGSDDEVTIDATVTDHADALTANGGDNLFELEVTAAERAYAVADLQLSITPDGGDAIDVDITLTDDADADGEVSQGDRLTAIETATNVVDDTHIGSDYQITLTYAPADGDPVDLFSGTWTAN